MSDDVGPLARTLAMPYYERALPAHDRYHANRVRDLAIRLANECERPVDRGVLSAAAWLHDIGRPRERVGDVDDHDRWAAREAADLLESEGWVPSEPRLYRPVSDRTVFGRVRPNRRRSRQNCSSTPTNWKRSALAGSFGSPVSSANDRVALASDSP